MFRCPVLENNIAQPKADKCPIFIVVVVVVVVVVVFSSSKQITVIVLHLI